MILTTGEAPGALSTVQSMLATSGIASKNSFRLYLRIAKLSVSMNGGLYLCMSYKIYYVTKYI